MEFGDRTFERLREAIHRLAETTHLAGRRSGPAGWEFDLPLRNMMEWIDRECWTLNTFR